MQFKTFLATLCLFAAIVSAEVPTCPSGKAPTYRLTIIDANVTTAGCTYGISINKGTCSFNTDPFGESNKYACINAVSGDCDGFGSFMAISTAICGNNVAISSLEYGGNMPLSQEFTMSNSDMTVSAFVGVYCDGAVTTAPRACNSFAGGLQAGLAVLVMLAIAFFALF